MSIWAMVFREIAYRKGNFLLGLAGVSAAIALLVGLLSSLQFHAERSERLVEQKQHETEARKDAMRQDLKRAMQHLGYNAIVLPRDQSLAEWYAEDYAAETMPESWAERLEQTEGLADRYLPRLRRKLAWEEKQWTILVVGVGEERILDTSVCEDEPLAPEIAPGSCVVGFELQQALGLEPGQEIVLLGRNFRIQDCAAEKGSQEDITIWMDLDDAQQLTGQPDAINEILIVEHRSVWGDVAEVRRRLAAVLPECQVVEIASETLSRAHARLEAEAEVQASIRQEREKQAMLQAERRSVIWNLAPLGLLVCASWIGFLMYLNVRERAAEVGVLRAIGFQARDVRALVLSKACLLGICGGLAGFAAGTAAAVSMELREAAGWSPGPGILLKQLGLALGMGVAASVLGSWLPARNAAMMDPAEVLHEE